MKNVPGVRLELDLSRVVEAKPGDQLVVSQHGVTIYVVDDGPGGTGEVTAIVKTRAATTISVAG